MNGFLDLASIMFVGKFSKRPMHFFGMWGTACFMIGFIITLILLISKMVDPSIGLTNRPGFYMALTAIILGMQLFLAGFVSELVARNASGRNHYLIEEKLGMP